LGFGRFDQKVADSIAIQLLERLASDHLVPVMPQGVKAQ
jgi:hypothetical protein